MSLIKCTRENRGSATAYFSRIIDDKFRRVPNGHLPFITEQDCFDQKSLLPTVLHPELEDMPFAIDHGDLSPLNIIVDSELNVTGIIDWGYASKVPIQLAGRFPRFPRFLQLQQLVIPPSPTLQEDRKAYVASLKS
ncbi:e5bd8db2-c2ee-4f87-83e1-d4eaa3249300 [Sclerotinia trifoliorum]|uniref:E5bd8db2-c2ee-4f87-83e1-d4eaa3249300 n=1 Tax=Sclerotinia trifoliorum TaxID=28548 RepID=A0A8H2ZUD7_9HELO|nr:e5bd8db2-c2ee-4f87-83e1-d4eaa3249300 [Sclerotinia trifoliorum]